METASQSEQLRLSAVERRVLEAAAEEGSRGDGFLRAQVLLACAQGASDNAVASMYGLDRSTVGRWRRRFQAEGASCLFAGTGHDPALLIPLNEVPTSGEAWTTRSTSAAAGLSQSTVARVWRAAAFRPPDSDVLLADPWFRGRARTLAGLHIGAAIGPLPAAEDAVARRNAEGSLRAALFCVDAQREPTASSRSRENERLAASEQHNEVWDAAVGTRQAITALATRLAPQPATHITAGLSHTIDQASRGLPAGMMLWVMLSRPIAAADRQRLATLGVRIHYTPSARSWDAVVVRSLAATSAMLAYCGVDYSPQHVTTALRLHADTAPATGHASWIESASTVQNAIEKARRPPRRRRSARRSAPGHRTPGAALVALQSRYADQCRVDLPTFEQVVAVRKALSQARPTAQACLDAMVVLAERQQARDLAEAALITYARQPWVELRPWEIADHLGLTTLHAVGQRQRRLARTTARGGRSRFSPATPAPRDTVRFDQHGRQRDLIAEAINDALARWHDDLVDHEHRRERLPTAEDTFGLLTYIVDPHRPVLTGADTDQGPQQRRQADARLGLLLVTDLVHQINLEVLAWHQLADTAAVPYSARGVPFGHSESGSARARRRLEARYDEASDNRHGASFPTANSRDLTDQIRELVARFEDHRAHLDDDEDVTDWLDLLAGDTPPLTFFLQLTTELTTLRDCGICGQRTAPGIRHTDGQIRCAHCAGCPELSTLAADCGLLAQQATSAG